MAQNTIFCIDNSSNSANGDFSPSRLRAQQEVAFEIAQLRLQSNPNNHVAVLSMAGKRPEVVLALSRNSSQLNRQLFGIQSSGAVDPLTSIRIAQLIHKVKRIRNSGLVLRLMLFIGSIPSIDADGQTRLLRMAAELGKDKVQVDMIAFGQLIEAREIGAMFQPFIDALGTGSQLLKINRGLDFLGIIFSQLNSLRGQARLNIPGLMSPDHDEADADLMMAIALSLHDLNKQHAKQEKVSNSLISTLKSAGNSSAIRNDENSAKTTTTVKVFEKVTQPMANRSSTSVSTSNSSTTSTSPSSLVKSVTVEKVANQSKNPFPMSTTDEGVKVNAKIFKTSGATEMGPRKTRSNSTGKAKTTAVKEVLPSPKSKSSVRAKSTPTKASMPISNLQANTRLAETDPGKRRVKRTPKQSFTSFVTSKNGKTSVGNRSSIKRSPAEKSKRSGKIDGPRLKTPKTTTKRSHTEASRVASQNDAELIRKISATDFYDNMKMKLFSKLNDNSNNNSVSAANIFQLKYDSWIYRSPGLYPRQPSSDSTSALFKEKPPPRRSANKQSVNPNRIQEMINAKMRSFNVASSSKIDLHRGSERTNDRSQSPAGRCKRASLPGSSIPKISAENQPVILKQCTTTSGLASEHKSPPVSNKKVNSPKSSSQASSGNTTDSLSDDFNAIKSGNGTDNTKKEKKSNDKK